MKKYSKGKQTLFFLILLIFVVSCQRSLSEKGRVILPQKTLESITWSEQDLKKEIAVQHLVRTKNSSTHVI